MKSIIGLGLGVALAAMPAVSSGTIKPARQRTTEHKHSREIARRLRQQARLEAKRTGDSQ